MANNPIRLDKQFMAINIEGKQQTAMDSPMSDADLNYRLKAAITVQEVVDRRTILDCDGRDIDDEVTRTRLKRFTLDLAAVNPQLMAVFGGYYFGATTAPTGTVTNEIQKLLRTGTVSGGYFTLSLTLEGRTGITGQIAWNATAAVIAAALIKVGTSIGKLLKAGDVAVTGDWTDGMLIELKGRMASADVPLFVVNSSGLTGSTPVVTVTEMTAGDSYFHPFTRSSDDVKPKFSFALGFKTGNLAKEKYYNAVVESYEPTLNRGGDVSLRVGILCNYEPVETVDLVVPPCDNFPPLATSDCRVQINNTWETLDVFAETITLNDNVPVDADTFGFDSVDPEDFERGVNPTYGISGSVFGVKTDPIGVVVAGEEKVEHITHFGMPGYRFSIIAGNTKMKPQANSRQFGGARNRSLIAYEGTPHRDGANPPVRAEAYLVEQDSAFLLT
jgi:hypothetical protein